MYLFLFQPFNILTMIVMFWHLQARILMFNCWGVFWPQGYHWGSLGKSHQNDYLKQQCKKVVPLQDFNLQPLDYWFTALLLELERMSLRFLNFGYLNPATCFYIYVNNNLIFMFRCVHHNRSKLLGLNS